MDSTEPAATTEKQQGAIWLNAWTDPVAGLTANPGCLELGDVTGDGSAKLLIADQQRKLRLYKGTNLISELTLLDVPTAIVLFVPDERSPVIPSVAVASGSHIFIYRKLRPYFKFTLPEEKPNEEEAAAWAELQAGRADVSRTYQTLSGLRDRGVELAYKSRDLLLCETGAEQAAFVQQHQEIPLEYTSVITCLATVKKSHDEDDAMSQLVIGTENRRVLVLDPVGNAAVLSVRLPAAPASIAVTGLFDVDYRLICACRNGIVYQVKGGEVLGSKIELDSPPVQVLTAHRSILIGCMENAFHSYHFKGKKNFTVTLPSPIQCMATMMVDKTRHLNLLLVALANGEVRVYNDKMLMSTITSLDVVTSMKFGKFSREEHTLVMAHKSGALAIRILSRHSTLEKSSAAAGPPPEQNVPLSVPKKTKLYVEQTQRERDSGIDIHRIFQRDLCKLRLKTARAYVKVLTDGQGPISYVGGSSIKLTASVSGLGPHYTIRLSAQNTGTKPIYDVPIATVYNPEMHLVKRPLLQMPILIPGPQYSVDIGVECICKEGGTDTVRIVVCNSKSCIPIISAIVAIPFCEPFV